MLLPKRYHCFSPGRLAAVLLSLLLMSMLAATGYASAELPRTGQRTCYDDKGTAVDQSATGQDGDLQAGAVWPDPRFTDNGDGTITDRLTGLMWLQDGSCLGRLSWQGAMDIAGGGGDDVTRLDSCRGLAAYKDWVLPEIGQLEVLFDAEEVSAGGWLNRHRFKNVQSAAYWSRTTGPNPYRAWVFHFDSGEVRLAGKIDLNFSLLVRQPAAQEGEEAASPTDGTAVAVRLVDNGDGTVTDQAAGLMWLKDGACLGSVSWQEGLQAIDDFNRDPAKYDCQGLKARYQDWSLPNRHELRSLIDHRRDLPALPADSPFIDPLSHYWTSTTAAARPVAAFGLMLGSGELFAVEKEKVQGLWPVRPVAGRPDRSRITAQELSAGAVKDPFLLEPIGGSRAIVWPVKRFTDHGDGTVTDNITGLMWLNDGACFLPETWENAGKVVEALNSKPDRLACAVYKGRYADWQLPDLATMRDLLQGAEGEPAAWLKSQGAADIIARDYWVQDTNPLNLYFAWAVNLQEGTPRNYPKSFELHVWPVRLPYVFESVSPAPLILGNGEEDRLFLKKGNELLLSAAIGQVTAAVPSLFMIWYVDPTGKKRWLNDQGAWVGEESALYRGNLFLLEQSPVFRGDTAELASGDYTFFFA
ncbi:MAG: DUF1566 domain-containing protein, partial [Proteobacteria bacterium]|nr:DUF1566 domain-containing protein [Pseudomonadota bacterium]